MSAGRRVEDGLPLHRYAPGDYGISEIAIGEFGWWARPPDAPEGFFANLSRHEVVEHEDGTITVTPSILIRAGALGEWHGYLERGVWRSA